jgi:hypothetical protein
MPNSVCRICGATVLGGGECSACELDIVGNCIRFVVSVVMFFALLACTSKRPIPVDVEHIGSEAEYTHGGHCIDSRSF